MTQWPEKLKQRIPVTCLDATIMPVDPRERRRWSKVATEDLQFIFVVGKVLGASDVAGVHTNVFGSHSTRIAAWALHCNRVQRWN